MIKLQASDIFHMVGSFKRPRGFLSPKQVSERAAKMGIALKPITLSALARKNLVPFAKKIPGNDRGLMFPESKLAAIIRAVPAKAILPEGSMTVYGLIKAAKKRHLKINLADIQYKLNRIMEGKIPAPEGLARDIIGTKHRYILPKEFTEQMLQKAELRENVRKKRKAGAAAKATKAKIAYAVALKWLGRNYEAASAGQRRLIEKIIMQNAHLPEDEFEKKALPALERILYR